MKSIKIKLFVTLVLTITGLKKRFVLGDMAYGEYLVYKDGLPKYFLHVCDDPLIGQRANGKNIDEYIEPKLITIEEGLSFEHNISGIPVKELEPQWFELKQLPSSLF